jgi:RNA polymerase sigma factor (sigma-70 family)
MNGSALAAEVRCLRGRLALQFCNKESDEQLLQAFQSRGDAQAFAGLVHRHGPMVFHVCRRVLGHEQDAEDAFQAAFLVLARNAAALRKKSSLASFLHGIAYRTAMKAKQAAARRRKHENQAPTRGPAGPADDLSWREVRALLDEEISRLPEAYRSVFILCCMESLSQVEAARRLGLKVRTVSSRLAEARKRLQRRLAQRGVELTAVLGVAALAAPPASALPAALMVKTIEAALPVAAAEELAGVVSPAVAELMKSAGATVWLSNSKVAGAILLVAGLLTCASVWAYRPWVADALAPSSQPEVASTANLDDGPKAAAPESETAKPLKIHGSVLGPDGQPKPGAKLLLLGRDGAVTRLGVSADDGRFTVTIPEKCTRHWGHSLVAQADGSALDFLDLYEMKHEKPIELRLVADNVIRGRVVSTEGKPIGGVRVAAESIETYGKNSLDTFRAAWMKLHAGGKGTGLEKQIYSGAAALFSTTTNADGRFTFQGMGAERTIRLRLSGAGIADTSVWVANRAGLDPKPFNQPVFDSAGKNHVNYRWSILSSPDAQVIAEPEKVIRGVVTDADTGKGQPGIVVRLIRDSDEMVHYPPQARTDAQGRYEIHGVRKTNRYLVAIDCNPDTGYMASQVWVDDTIAHQSIRADIKVKKGVIVTGKVLDGATGEPIRGYVMASVLMGNPFGKEYPRFSEMVMMPFDSGDDTDADRAYRVVTIPGPVLLMAKPEGESRLHYKGTGADPKYPQYFRNAGYYAYNSMWPLQGTWNKVLEIKPGVPLVKQDIVLERASVVALVRLQDAEGRPLAGAWASANGPRNYVPYGWLESDSCSVYGDPIKQPQLLAFYHRGKKLVGTRTLKADEKEPAIVKLGPPGALKGRLLDSDGKPLAGVIVDLRYLDYAAKSTHEEIYDAKQIVTDANGAFTIDTVIPELRFALSFPVSKRRQFQPAMRSANAALQVKPGECRDLGAITLSLSEKKGE